MTSPNVPIVSRFGAAITSAMAQADVGHIRQMCATAEPQPAPVLLSADKRVAFVANSVAACFALESDVLRVIESQQLSDAELQRYIANCEWLRADAQARYDRGEGEFELKGTADRWALLRDAAIRARDQGSTAA